MTYEQFKKRIDIPINRISGFDHSDMCDAPWRDLYDSTNQGEDVTDHQIVDLLAQYDDLFALMLEVE